MVDTIFNLIPNFTPTGFIIVYSLSFLFGMAVLLIPVERP